MNRLAPCLAVVPLVFASAAMAQAPPGVPLAPSNKPVVFEAGGTAPAIGVVDGVQGADLMFRQNVYTLTKETRNVQITRKIVEDGKEREVTETVPQTFNVMKPRAVSSPYPLAKVLVFDSDAKPIPAERVPGLFARPRMVLWSMSAASPPVDPGFLKLARDGTPFVVLPAMPAAPAPLFSVAPGPGSSTRPRPTAEKLAAPREVAEFTLSPFNDEDLKSLEKSELRILDLYGTSITDAGLLALKGLSGLECLRMGQTAITGAGLDRTLPGLTGLKSLRVQKNPKIGDAQIATIGRLTKLEDLNLWGTAITDQGLRNLSGLTELRVLNLGATPVTDAGLEALKVLKKLKYVTLGMTRVSQPAADALKQARPDLAIEGFGQRLGGNSPPPDPWLEQITTASQVKP
jgi:hypothetical protein